MAAAATNACKSCGALKRNEKGDANLFYVCRRFGARFPGLQRRVSEVPYPSAEGVKTLLDDIAPRTPKAATADPKSFVEMSLVQELEASGFIKRLYKR